MDFVFTKQEEKFRTEVKQFIEKEKFGDGGGFLTEGEEYEEGWEYTRGLAKKLANKGWLTISWPKDYGGQDRPIMEQVVYLEEMAYNRMPSACMDMGVGGISWVGPTLMIYGDEEQKKEHISKIGAGERFWCTGYSEPESGSDLASLQTRAVSDGDDYVVNGQKIWNSGGHKMDWCWLAVRTDPEAPKHKGISLLLVDMKSPGISVRPIVNMAGSHHFNEIFFEDVRVPKRNRVGDENRGWYYVAVALDYERSYISQAASMKRGFDDLLQLVKESNGNGGLDMKNRARLADIAIDIEIVRLMCYRIAWMQGQKLVPNQEASMCKLFATEAQQRQARAATAMLGLYGLLDQDSKHAPAGGIYGKDYLLSVSATIAGGTSEIQRGIIARRGLGLPRD